MRIVCQQTILIKYHVLFVIYEKPQNFKLWSAANYRWCFMGLEASQSECGYLLVDAVNN